MNAQYALSARTQNYHSYLVRLWRDHPHAPWRATAQCVQTGVTHHFVDLAALNGFLQTQTTEADGPIVYQA